MARQRPPSLLNDVAKASGVAKSTVSRILNNRHDGFSVKQETRERVIAVATRLNYRPNPMVRSICAKRTNLVAVLGLHGFDTPLRPPAEVAVKPLMEALYSHGIELCTNVMSPAEGKFAPPRWRVDGVVAVDCSHAEELKELDASGVPYVSLNGEVGPGGSSVTVDDEGGTREAVYHLIELGHRKIAFAMPRGAQWDVWHQSLSRRHKAYIATLAEVGLDPVPGHDSSERTETEFVRTAVLEHGATAIVAYHLDLAVRLLRATLRLDLKVPQDVSLVCFNDLAPCADLIPSLTALSLPIEAMGQQTAGLLLERIKSDQPVPTRKIVLPEKLVVRESTAPPPTR